MNDGYKDMLRDTVYEMISLLRDAQVISKSGDQFELGRKIGILEAVSLLQDNARTFGLNLREIGVPEDDIEIIMLKWNDS